MILALRFYEPQENGPQGIGVSLLEHRLNNEGPSVDVIGLYRMKAIIFYVL